MDATIPNASDRKTTMTAWIRRAVPAALAALLLAACGQQAPTPAGAEPAVARGAHASLTGDPVCAGPGVHDVHVALFRCDTCHPTGATFGFDRPFTFAGGTTTAGGTLASGAAGITCTVACHFPKGSPPAPVSWSAAGPLACTSCHSPAALPEPHPPVAANASREDCEACHLMGGHLAGSVAVRGHGPEWMAPAGGGFHAAAANESLASCRGCHGPDLAGSAGAGCGSCHDEALPPGVASWKVNCVMCHGGVDLASGAPPRATWGNGGDEVRVGAHTKHLTASALAPAAACSDCHSAPADVFAAGHLDGGTAEVVFARARAGQTPSWDRATATCASTWCHAGVAGGARPTPVWTSAGDGEGACGACHGLPPPAPHPAVSGDLAGCVGCHALTMAAPGVVVAPSAGGAHLNGSVEATGGHPAAFKDPASPEFHAFAANRGLGPCQGCHGEALDGVGGSTTVACTTCHGAGFTSRCTACHGGVADASGAPPKPTWGGAGDPLRVGAHQVHVTGGAVGAPIACDICHVVPADALSAGHLGEPFAEVRFAGLAAGPGSAPAWDRSTGSCSATYCHGTYSGTYEYWFWEDPLSFSYARTGGAPAWTGGSMTCSSCHGLPPTGGTWHSGFHGGGNGCNVCHPGVDAAATVITDRTKHLNGAVDVRWSGSGCSNCH
jgi:predicted CxxxxCH...CXXCH cytochrome family protein